MKLHDDGASPREVPPAGGAPATKQARSALSTRKLLDAAAELISEVGLTNTTLAMIGERAGYSHGLVTRRFGSKEGLLLALVDRMTIGWFETYVNPAIDEADGLEGLRIRVATVRDGWKISTRRMRALYSLMFEAAIQPLPSLTEQMQELNRIALSSTEEATARGVRDGSIRSDVDPKTVARQLTAQFRGVAYLAMLLPDEFDVFEAFADIEAYVDSLAGASTR
ncbi:TetR/AcrR family transcriptional regulator [Cumulibacter manganitolerans]|uniref:TetR/AcrR family transcriptional regulator n=1 Tax=Cumulibacter manganitolerans TaxID=1884992 RepID=UPI001295343A|nr:TetR/AcrR family transcriptional regulator [Cumulibacter manganitolerans]